jgi:hypothetical protein
MGMELSARWTNDENVASGPLGSDEIVMAVKPGKFVSEPVRERHLLPLSRRHFVVQAGKESVKKYFRLGKTGV